MGKSQMSQIRSKQLKGVFSGQDVSSLCLFCTEHHNIRIIHKYLKKNTLSIKNSEWTPELVLVCSIQKWVLLQH